MQVFGRFFIGSEADGGCFEARKPMADVFVMVCRMLLRKKRGAPTHAFAFPIRKRMFLPEHILQCGCGDSDYFFFTP
jgi:hypothetical protein